MTDRNEMILRAALKVFLQFGVGKTTMNDIAAEAGVARQTVYNAFPSKPEILRAATRLAIRDVQSEVADAWSKAGSLEEKIDIYFKTGPLYWYDKLQTTPTFGELMEGMNEHASDEVKKSMVVWTDMVEEAITAEGLRPVEDNITPRDLAEFFFFSSHNAKYHAGSRDAVEARLRTIKAALINLLH